MTDSCKEVVTLSRYSICSFTAVLDVPDTADADTREFFAIINSLTRFIKVSSFSISTLTVLFTTGLLATGFFSSVFLPVLAGAAGAGAAGAGAVCPSSCFSAASCLAGASDSLSGSRTSPSTS